MFNSFSPGDDLSPTWAVYSGFTLPMWDPRRNISLRASTKVMQFAWLFPAFLLINIHKVSIFLFEYSGTNDLGYLFHTRWKQSNIHYTLKIAVVCTNICKVLKNHQDETKT